MSVMNVVGLTLMKVNMNKIDDLRGDNMNTMSTDLTKEDLQLIYLLLHKVPISYTMTIGMEYEVLDLIEKVGKEIDNRLLKGE